MPKIANKIDYGVVSCRLKSCKKKVVRTYRNRHKKFCDKYCYTKWMRGRTGILYRKRKKETPKVICNGISCRGEKKFRPSNGEHYCPTCRDMMKGYGEEISVIKFR